MASAETIEEWRPVKGYEGCYEVSSLGRVRSLLRWRSSQRPGIPRLMAYYLNVKGYQYINLSRDKRTKARSVHSLVLEAFTCQRPGGHEASHLDGNRLNNSATNLAWETPRENAIRKRAHGTQPVGEKQVNARLTATKVLEILRRSKLGESRSSIAMDFGVNPTTISQIALGRMWQAVTGLEPVA